MNTVTAGIASLPANATRTLTVEILLADPGALGDDVLESCTSRAESRGGRHEQRAREPSAGNDGAKTLVTFRE